jgi:hypothetical protein
MSAAVRVIDWTPGVAGSPAPQAESRALVNSANVDDMARYRCGMVPPLKVRSCGMIPLAMRSSGACSLFPRQ